MANEWIELKCSKPLIGTYVKVVTTLDANLDLTEVQVLEYREPFHNKYGLFEGRDFHIVSGLPNKPYLTKDIASTSDRFHLSVKPPDGTIDQVFYFHATTNTIRDKATGRAITYGPSDVMYLDGNPVFEFRNYLQGYCQDSNGNDQNTGVQKLHSLDVDTPEREAECLNLCKAVDGVTGCEGVKNVGGRGCYAHTSSVAMANGGAYDVCWVKNHMLDNSNTDSLSFDWMYDTVNNKIIYKQSDQWKMVVDKNTQNTSPHQAVVRTMVDTLHDTGGDSWYIRYIDTATDEQFPF